MPYARGTIAKKLEYYPFYQWEEPLSKWEDDEFEDEKYGTIEERRGQADSVCGKVRWEDVSGGDR